MKYPSTPSLELRYRVLLIAFLIIFVVIFAKVIHLQWFQKEFLQHQGDARIIRTQSYPAYRGTITDRHGEPLAISTPVYAIWANPPEFHPNKKQLASLAKLIELPEQQLQDRVTDNKNRSFVYLRRQTTPEMAQEVEALKIKGVYLKREFKRYYPSGEVTSQLIGFTNVDDVGQEGLELIYDQWLKGTDGQRLVIKDRMGTVVSDLGSIEQAKPGHSLMLTIDKRLQYIAYKALKATVQEHNALAGSLVLLDIQSGDVLAMVNQPSYNPNNRAAMRPANLRNRAATDSYEPGSVMKVFSLAAALETGHFDPAKPIDTSPGWMMVGSRKVRDLRNFGALDMTGILQKSSNVGVTKIMMQLPPNAMAKFFKQIGFGAPTGSHFPGEQQGVVLFPRDQDVFSQATQAFGYGLSVTTLQLAQAFAAIGHQGYKVPVNLIKHDQQEAPKKERVMSEKTAAQVLTMMEQVVGGDGGSASRAKVAGYTVAGKTGTARKLGDNGYDSKRHRAVFAGLVPASRPRLVMVVMIDEPREGEYYGGLVAAPIFGSIMEKALRILDIAPDDVDSEAAKNLNFIE